RGDMPAGARPGSFQDDTFDEAAHETAVAEPTMSTAYYHAERALSAALFHDTPTLAHHAGLAMSLTARTPGNYINTWIYLLQALAQADALRALGEEDDAGREPLLKAFDGCV